MCTYHCNKRNRNYNIIHLPMCSNSNSMCWLAAPGFDHSSVFYRLSVLPHYVLNATRPPLKLARNAEPRAEVGLRVGSRASRDAGPIWHGVRRTASNDNYSVSFSSWSFVRSPSIVKRKGRGSPLPLIFWLCSLLFSELRVLTSVNPRE